MSMTQNELNDEIKRDVARRLYDEGTTVGHNGAQEAFMDGLWIGMMNSGMKMEEFERLEEEIWSLVDGLIEGEWE